MSCHDSPGSALDLALRWSRSARWSRAEVGDYGVVVRDTVQMLDRLGIRYVLAGPHVLAPYGMVRACIYVEFAVFEDDVDAIREAPPRFGFTALTIRSRLRHAGEQIAVRLATDHPEVLAMAYDLDERIIVQAAGIEVPILSLRLAILRNLLAPEWLCQGTMDVIKLVVRSDALRDPASPEVHELLDVIEDHPQAPALRERWDGVMSAAIREIDDILERERVLREHGN